MDKILIAGGGTFGHIAPALALKKNLEDKGCTVYYVCAERDKKFPFYQTEKNILTVKLSGMPRRNPLQFIRFIFLLGLSKITALRHIIRIKPSKIIATGGFVCFPYLLWAFLLRIPFFICEQNSFPGIVNRIFSRSAKQVFLSMELAGKTMKGRKELTGNPVRMLLIQDKNEAAQALGVKLIPGKKVIGMIGGSQGALKLNQWLLDNQEKLAEQGYQIILSAGKLSYKDIEARKRTEALTVFEFITAMGAFYSVCDLFVSRSGASTISELLQVKKPVVFIPYPYASDNHQYYNALFAAKYIPAEVVLEKELDSKDLLQILNELTGKTPEKTDNPFEKALDIITERILSFR